MLLEVTDQKLVYVVLRGVLEVVGVEGEAAAHRSPQALGVGPDIPEEASALECGGFPAREARGTQRSPDVDAATSGECGPPRPSWRLEADCRLLSATPRISAAPRSAVGFGGLGRD